MGPALMVVWSGALQSLTSAQVRIQSGSCDKVASDLWFGGGCPRVIQSSPSRITGKSRFNHKKVTKIEFPNL